MLDIAGPDLSASINPLGAELTSLRDGGGREWMTDANPAFWTGHAPLLFPIVGALNRGKYRVGGQEYALPQHGFARRRAFELVEQAPDRARFRLTDDAQTAAVFPFAFALDADYAIEGSALTMAITVANRDATDMPASFGFHPAFAWPLPGGGAREAHRITFETDEPSPLRSLSEGLILSNRFSPLDGRTLHLSDALFERDALIWDRLDSRSVVYASAEGPSMAIEFPDAPMLGIWSRPGARFVCVEPWWGIADPRGFKGDIWDKPGILRFAPGESRTFTMKVTLRS